MRWVSALVALIAACCIVLPCAEGAVREETFAALKTSNDKQLVLFYHSKEADSKPVLQTFERASAKTRKLRELKFKKCDCDSAANLQECKEASFNSGSFIFTSTPETGIVKFISPITVDNLVTHANTLFLEYDEKDVLKFVDEESLYERIDSDPPRSVIVKFYEEWCGHCQRLKPTFARAATHFKGKVDFLEVRCSENSASTAFCSRNQVSSYPVVMLFTGEKKIKFEKEERSLLTFTRFFEENVPGFSSSKAQSQDDDDSEPEAPKETPKETPKEQPKKRASSDDDDDDELDEEEERRAREQAKEEKKKRKQREREEKQKREEREAEEKAKRDKAKEEKDKSDKAKEEQEKKTVKPPYGGSQSGVPAGDKDDSNKAASASASAPSGGASDQRVDALENRVKFLVQRVTQLEEFREAQDQQLLRLKKRVKALKLQVRGLTKPAAAASHEDDDDDKDEL